MQERRERQSWRGLLVGAAALAALPAAAAAQGADELASTIEQTLAGIEFRVDVRPEQAAQDLEEQERRLELLEKEAPDHPALPKLRQAVEDLQGQIADSLAGAAGDAARGDTVGPMSAPPALATELRRVESLQDQAEDQLSRGRTGEAEGLIKEVEVQVAELEARHQGEIPRGHVPLLVVKERLAALKDQLGGAGASGSDAPAQ